MLVGVRVQTREGLGAFEALVRQQSNSARLSPTEQHMAKELQVIHCGPCFFTEAGWVVWKHSMENIRRQLRRLGVGTVVVHQEFPDDVSCEYKDAHQFVPAEV